MNIVLDDGLTLDDGYREILSPLLPPGNAPLRLNSFTSRTDGTIKDDEGIVFLTNLPVDVLKYHSIFFDLYKNLPQWFFVLLNKNDHGLTNLKNAARKIGLKNCALYHAYNAETFKATINAIVNEVIVRKGKTLLLTKHKRSWVSDLAQLLFGDDESKYEIMNSVDLSETDAEELLLCGEKINDFKGVECPNQMEPYFVFQPKEEPQHLIDTGELVNVLAEYYHMTSERVEERLFLVDIESEIWLTDSNKPIGNNAAKEGILLCDRFGLPVSRAEYTEQNIMSVAQKNHENLEELKRTLMQHHII